MPPCSRSPFSLLSPSRLQNPTVSSSGRVTQVRGPLSQLASARPSCHRTEVFATERCRKGDSVKKEQKARKTARKTEKRMRWRDQIDPRRVAMEGRIGCLTPKVCEARKTSVRTYLLTKRGAMRGVESNGEDEGAGLK